MGGFRMNFIPEKDYEGLLKQARAMHRIIEAMEKSKSIQGKTVDDLTRQFLICNSDAIESERETNQMLTEYILTLENENQELRIQNDRLSTIFDDAPDLTFEDVGSLFIDELSNRDSEVIDNFIRKVCEHSYMAFADDEIGDSDLVVSVTALQNVFKRL
jgi:CRISPR/Cas system CSM-associated protein Csm4 (group 5 of RAMP superfamily)